MFSYVGLSFDVQTKKFLKACHRKHDNNEYPVFKDKSVKDKWINYLDHSIRDEIYQDLIGTDLEIYLYD